MIGHHIILHPEQAGYEVQQNEVAFSRQELKTSGLYTCVGFYIHQDGQNMLGHIDASGNAYILAGAIKDHFDLTKPMTIRLINAYPRPEQEESASQADLALTSHPAKNICLDAIKKAFGLRSREEAEKMVEYVPVRGGFLGTVRCDQGHVTSFMNIGKQADVADDPASPAWDEERKKPAGDTLVNLAAQATMSLWFNNVGKEEDRAPKNDKKIP